MNNAVKTKMKTLEGMKGLLLPAVEASPTHSSQISDFVNTSLNITKEQLKSGPRILFSTKKILLYTLLKR